jgi:hypothetical protein
MRKTFLTNNVTAWCDNWCIVTAISSPQKYGVRQMEQEMCGFLRGSLLRKTIFTIARVPKRRILRRCHLDRLFFEDYSRESSIFLKSRGSRVDISWSIANTVLAFGIEDIL